MSHPQITHISAWPPASSLAGRDGTAEYVRSRQRAAEPLRKRAQAGLAGRDRPARRVSRASVLSASQFTALLDRERNLADRGDHRFSWLILQERTEAHGNTRARDQLRKLARRACENLRSTDLVGRLAEDRVEILLSDTEHAGARVVAAWVKQVGTELGLDLEQEICVYPPLDGQRTDDGVRTNAKATNGHLNGHQNGHLHGHEPRTRPEASMGQDGWLLLDVPTPWWKRSLDIVLSAIALLLLSPLFLLVAIAIQLDSPGPVIFRQMRAGRGGRPFVFYKFRSMVADAECRRVELAALNERDGPIFKIRRDPRITRLGRVLRRGSIDELPQLWNVLKGDMSLVGPRPPTLDEVRKYEPWQRRRLCVTGGITCSWQVSGRSELSFQEWMRLDMRYIACRSPWEDLRLLAQTVPAVITGRGAC